MRRVVWLDVGDGGAGLCRLSRAKEQLLDHQNEGGRDERDVHVVDAERVAEQIRDGGCNRGQDQAETAPRLLLKNGR